MKDIGGENLLDVSNRKYLGSKYRLLDFLENTILNNVKRDTGVFIDIFAGTGVVGNHFRKSFKKVIANDILFSNYITNKVFLNTAKDNTDLNKIEELINKLNALPPKANYFYKNYGDKYFTKQNSKYIDAIRAEIQKYKIEGLVTTQEYYVLLASLLFACDKVSNTVGQYDAFLKNIGSKHFEGGKHLVDSNVYKKIELKMPRIIFDGINEVYCEDANSLIKKIKGDVLYLDPPYNTRQYSDCYHVLENIARWDKPALFGKTAKFDRSLIKSKYSSKIHAEYAFKELILAADVKHIFVSYNNEGIIDYEKMKEILSEKGEVKVFEQEYGVFGNGAGVSKNRKVIERLFYCKVNMRRG